MQEDGKYLHDCSKHKSMQANYGNHVSLPSQSYAPNKMGCLQDL